MLLFVQHLKISTSRGGMYALRTWRYAVAFCLIRGRRLSCNVCCSIESLTLPRPDGPDGDPVPKMGIALLGVASMLLWTLARKIARRNCAREQFLACPPFSLKRTPRCRENTRSTRRERPHCFLSGFFISLAKLEDKSIPETLQCRQLQQASPKESTPPAGSLDLSRSESRQRCRKKALNVLQLRSIVRIIQILLGNPT